MSGPGKRERILGPRPEREPEPDPPRPEDAPPEREEPDRDAHQVRTQRVGHATALAHRGRILDGIAELDRRVDYMGDTMTHGMHEVVMATREASDRQDARERELLDETRREHRRRKVRDAVEGLALAVALVAAILLFTRAEARALRATEERAAIREDVQELRLDVDGLLDEVKDLDGEGGAWAGEDHRVWSGAEQL